MFLRVICVLVLSGILVAGLWPFRAPKNDVQWSNQRNGLLFGEYGSIVSAGRFEARPQGDGPCSLEIWLEPKWSLSSGTILAFYSADSHLVTFSLRQSRHDLELQSASSDPLRQREVSKTYVENVFSRHTPVLFTLSSNQEGTTIYADGVLVRKVPNFRISSQNLTGRLIIANSAVKADEWLGRVRGLAMYDRAWTADEVSHGYVVWTKGPQRALAADSSVALYLFQEGTGNTVHNQVDSATDLVIPERFFVLHQQFLERPWDEFRPGSSYWKDVGVNVAGFIPLGLFFYVYLSGACKVEHSAAITVALGFAVSLTIEVLQAFLPTRNSGMTDLLTNTLGTAIGVMLFRRGTVRALMSRVLY